jgi:hypothetical protein
MAVAKARQRALHVVVTCAHRKTRPVPPSLRLGDLARRGRRLTADEWVARLEGDETPAVAARVLYAGEHWDVARRIDGHQRDGRIATVWVASAGYGLIPVDAEVRPYSATFSSGHRDSVPGGPSGAAEWWRTLAAWPGPAKAPRTLRDLASRQRGARVLVVLSPPYLAAAREDIAAAASAAADGAVSIVSAGSRSLGDLQELLLPADARLQAALGGTRQSLNARIAAHLVDSGADTHEAMREHLGSLLRRQPPVPVFDRRRMTEAEVRGFIRGRLRGDPSATHSRLLRELRTSGRACEQVRFAALFAEEMDGGR